MGKKGERKWIRRDVKTEVKETEKKKGGGYRGMKRFAFSYVDAKFNYVRFFRNWMITVLWNVPMG